MYDAEVHFIMLDAHIIYITKLCYKLLQQNTRKREKTTVLQFQKLRRMYCFPVI